MDNESDSKFAPVINDGLVVLSNGVRVVNTSPHPFVFDEGTVVEPCGVALNAQFVETHYATSSEGVQFVRTDKVPTDEGAEFVSAAKAMGVLLLGSAIAVEAYGFPVVGCIPTPETAGRGTPPADRRVQSERFNSHNGQRAQ